MTCHVCIIWEKVVSAISKLWQRAMMYNCVARVSIITCISPLLPYVPFTPPPLRVITIFVNMLLICCFSVAKISLDERWKWLIEYEVLKIGWVLGIVWAETLAWFEGGFTAYPGQGTLVCSDQTQCISVETKKWRHWAVSVVCTVHCVVCTVFTVCCVQYVYSAQKRVGKAGMDTVQCPFDS